MIAEYRTRLKELFYELVARLGERLMTHIVTVEVPIHDLEGHYKEMQEWFAENHIRWRLRTAPPGPEPEIVQSLSSTDPRRFESSARVAYRFLRVEDAVHFKLRWG